MCYGPADGLPAAPSVPVRIGLHMGSVVVEEDKVYGDSVNLASRIESLSVPGAVLFSRTIRNEIKNQPDIKMASLGSFSFKNVEEPVEVFALANEGFLIPPPEKPKENLVKSRNKWLVPVLAIVLLLGAAGLWKFGAADLLGRQSQVTEKDSSPISRDIREKRVAVMVFENKTGSDQLEDFGNMISDWITQGLIEIGTPRVVSAFDVQRYAETVSKREKEGASLESLDAEVTIQGRYYRQEDQLILHANIMDNRTGEIIYALDPIIGTEREAMQILDQLTQKLLGYWMLGDRAMFAKKPPRYDAYQEYMKYHDVWGIDFQQAAVHLQKAYQLDTTFDLALIRVGMALNNSGRLAKADSLIQEVKQRKKTLSTYDELYLKKLESIIHGKDQETADVSLKMWELFPGDQLTQLTVGLSHIKLNQPQKAIEFYEEIIDFDNIGDCNICQWNFGRLLYAYYRLGQYEKILSRMASTSFKVNYGIIPQTHLRALVRLEKTERLQSVVEEYQSISINEQPPNRRLPLIWVCDEAFLADKENLLQEYATRLKEIALQNTDAEFYHGILSRAYFWLEDYEKSYQHFQELNVQHPVWLTIPAICLIKMGRKDEIEGFLQTIRANNWKFRNAAVKVYAEAIIQAHLGEKERAMELLKTANEKGAAFYMGTYKQDGLLKPLHGYPPFEEFVKPK